MAIPLSASRMVEALRAEGVRVQEYRNWRTHNRNSRGAWGEVNGVMIHHTAGVGSGMAAFCYDGNSGLPGPLCHAFVDKAGTVYMIGSGRANHAGTIAENAHQAVVAESRMHPHPHASEPIDGNRAYYGIEIENRGDGSDPYPAGQYEQAVRWAAAICRAHGWSADSVIGHKEGTRRKIDPSFSMTTFRADVAGRLKGGPGGGGERDDDMPIRTSLGKDQVQEVPWNVWTPVRWDVEHSDPEGTHTDGNYPGYVPKMSSWADFGGRIVVEGLIPGDQVQVRYEVWDWKDGAKHGEPWTEIVADQSATPGRQYVSVPCSKRLSKGQHAYVSVKPIPGQASEDAAAPRVVDGRWTIRQDAS